MATDVFIVSTLSALVSAFSLGWMLFNLIVVMRREGLSWEFKKRMAQTKEILLKPAILFFGTGALSSAYMALRGWWAAA